MPGRLSFRHIPLTLALGLAVLFTPALAATQDFEPPPGMGQREDAPEGESFKLPEGLTVESIKGYSSSDPEDCDHKYADQAVGKGEQVRVCLILNNQTNAPITLQMPPGLIFISRKLQHQNGMIAQRISIEVPAKTRYFQPLFAYCINGSRDSSSGDSEYDLGPVTNAPGFEKLFEFLEDKVIDDVNFVAVNVAIGELADGADLTFAQAGLDAL